MEILKKGNDLLLSQILKEVFFYLYIIFLIKNRIINLYMTDVMI